MNLSSFLVFVLILLVPIFMIAYGIGLFLWMNRNKDRICDDARRRIEKYQGSGLWRRITRWFVMSPDPEYLVFRGSVVSIALVVMGVICLVILISWTLN